MQMKNVTTSEFSSNMENELQRRNASLLEKNIPQQLLIISQFKDKSSTDFYIQFFLEKHKHQISWVLSEDLRVATSGFINEYIIDVLNDIGRSTFDLGFLDIEYKLPSKSEILEAMKSTKRCSQIEVSISSSGEQFGFTLKKRDDFILSNICFGYFPIHLRFRSYSKDNSYEQHRVTGFIDKLHKTIYTYDGARWIDFQEGINSLRKYFSEILPDYKLEILIKSHQTDYGFAVKLSTMNNYEVCASYSHMLDVNKEFLPKILNSTKNIHKFYE